MLVGDKDGLIHFLANDSQSGRLAFLNGGALSVQWEPIRVQEGMAAPLAVDWDADGQQDLLVGTGAGSVVFFRRLGFWDLSPGAELIGEAESTLLQISEGTWTWVFSTKRSGRRAKIASADWNGDGSLDLLVGDYASVQGPRPVLSKEQHARADALAVELNKLRKQLLAERRRVTKEVDIQLGLDGPLDDLSDPILNSRERALSRALAEDPGCLSLSSQITMKKSQLAPLQARRTTHGWVWVYLAK